MKKFQVITQVFLLALLVVLGGYAWQNVGIVEFTQKVVPFHGISTGGLMNVYVSQGTEESVIVRIDEEYQDQVQVQVEKGILKIYSHGTIRGERVTDAYVTYKTLDQLHAGDASTLTVRQELQAPSVKLVADGAAELKVLLQTDSLALVMNDNANVQLAGNAKSFNFSITHVGDLMAYNMISKNCTATMKTGKQSPGIARVNVVEQLAVEIDGPRHLYYKGSPKITHSSLLGGGQLLRK